MGLFCLAVAWTFVFSVGWSVWAVIRDSAQMTQRLHQIPCANCQFFTGSYVLKCAVNPVIALSEEARYCSDYSPR